MARMGMISLTRCFFAWALVTVFAASVYSQNTVSVTLGSNTYTIIVAPEHPRDGYDRDDWDHWDRIPDQPFNVRDQVLIDESLVPVTINQDASGWRQRVLTGRWICPYTGREFTESSDVDVDHLVPLAEAWDSGGWAWSDEHREKYANYLGDPDHLIIVEDNENQRKSDDDPADYLPVASYVCDYIEDWLRIKEQWGLTVDQRELEAIRRVEARCE